MIVFYQFQNRLGCIESESGTDILRRHIPPQCKAEIDSGISSALIVINSIPYIQNLRLHCPGSLQISQKRIPERFGPRRIRHINNGVEIRGYIPQTRLLDKLWISLRRDYAQLKSLVRQLPQHIAHPNEQFIGRTIFQKVASPKLGCRLHVFNTELP